MDLRDLNQPLTPHPDRRGVVRYLQAFRRHWPLVLLLVIVTVSVTAAITLTKPKTYEASADLSIYPQSSTDPNFQGTQVFKDSLDGSSPVVAAARAMNTRDIRERTRRRLDGASNVSLSAAPLSQVNIVSAKATARSAELAARAADTFARVFARQRTKLFHKDIATLLEGQQALIAQIPADQRNTNNPTYLQYQTRIATLRGYLSQPDPSVLPTAPAEVPSSPAAPRPKLSIAVAFLAALLLGCGVAVAL